MHKLSVTLVALISGSLWKYAYKMSITVTIMIQTAKMFSANETLKSVIQSLSLLHKRSSSSVRI